MMMLTIKMFFKTIILTMIIVGHPCASAKSRPPRSIYLTDADIKEEVMLSEKTVDADEPVFSLECPLEHIIQPKADMSNDFLDAQLDLIKSLVGVEWSKDGQPGLNRPNTNLVEYRDKFTAEFYQTGETDSGSYTCQLYYSRVPRNLTDYFEFHRSATFYLRVIKGLPNTAPIIKDPPTNHVVSSGSNATFTCNRTETLSHQTTFWFKSCPFNETACVKAFNEAFREASQDYNIHALHHYLIEGESGDTLTVHNVTFNLTGYYGCAVRSSLGMDTRLGKLQLINQLLDEKLEAAALGQLQAANLNHSDWIWFSIGIFAFLSVGILSSVFVYFMKLSMTGDKKQQHQQTDPLIAPEIPASGTAHKESNLRQHLPNMGCPNIYNISKSADGFIAGHLHQNSCHLMAQSICSNVLDKGNPSISSSNSHQSDEASTSWGKSVCSQGDNCRSFYLHTSNTTATTMPMYDHPSTNGTLRHCMVQNSCVINPTYGFLRPENDTTDWAFPRRNLERLDKIGEGQFGDVWRYVARQKDGRDQIVAVKQLKHRIGFGDRERLELIAEIEIMKSVNKHPNVIKLLHCCIDEYEPILLIMEYAEHGKLQTYLRNCRASSRHYGLISDSHPISITSKELVKFTYHIAKGMEYVAAQGIVHRDLASRNILLSKDKVCKVADFGFARRVNEDAAYERTTTNPVPVKWMAPEALTENKFTSKSDVYSLGILMWEIVTLGATPYEQLSSEGVCKKVAEGGRLDRPTHCSDEFYDLMARCWLHDPALRPTFKEVSNELEKLLLSDNDYIKLDQYPEHAYYNIINMDEKQVVNIET